MPRIEIELTSSRADGSWTWRAAGARQPKGVLDGSLLPGGAKVGDVVRADVDVDIDGMNVSAVYAPKAKKQDEGRLEVIGSERPPPPPVTSTWAGDGDGRDSRDRRGRGGPGGRDRAGAGPGGGAGASRGDRDRDRGPGGPRGRPAAGSPGGGRPGGGRPGGGRPGAPTGPPAERTGPPRADRGAPSRGDRGGPPRERRDRPAGPAGSAQPPARPRPKRLNPGRTHRDAALAGLPPEERPVAEQLLRGGIPAVRQALDEQNAAARASGAPEVKAEALLALAERLLPKMRAAEWLDRAEAAAAQADEVALRDLRAIVAGADAAGREEAGRELAAKLRQSLDDRSAKERDSWLAEITEALEAGRVVRALRASSRPPEPGVRFPPPLAERLSTVASQALTSDVAPDRWAAVLEAVSASPVRRMVKPQGLPGEAPPELVKAARMAAERVPGLIALVGEPPAPAGGRRPPSGTGDRSRGATAPPRRRPPAPPGAPRPAIGARRPAPPPPPPRPDRATAVTAAVADGAPAQPPPPRPDRATAVTAAVADGAPAEPAEAEPAEPVRPELAEAEGPATEARVPTDAATEPPAVDSSAAEEAAPEQPAAEPATGEAGAGTQAPPADQPATGQPAAGQPPVGEPSSEPASADTGSAAADGERGSDDRGDDAVLVEELG